MMKNILTLLLCVSFYTINAQQFDQLTADTADFQFNPDLATAELTSYPNHVVSTALESKTIIYGQDIFGIQHVRSHDNQGNLVYDIEFGNSACIDWITGAANGNVYVAGAFMDTLSINGQDTLIVNNSSLFNVNAFLLCIEPAGTIAWKRNLTLQHAGLTSVDMLTLDGAGNCWYSYCDWQAGFIVGTNSNGQDVTSYLMNGGIRTISGLSFDSAGNLFASGSCESGTITIGNFSKLVTDTYNMYLTRFNAAGNVSWFIDMHDITFQHPRVKADAAGNAFFSGVLMDSATLGNFSMPAPQWGLGLILAKIDSGGNALWVRNNPVTPTITGAFQVGRGLHLAVDHQGGCIITGRTTGIVDWGNNVITGQPVIGNTYTHSIISFDQNGIAQWSLNAQSSYVNPVTLILTSNTIGYVTSFNRGSIQYGSMIIPHSWPYTLSTVLTRFSFGTSGLSEKNKEVKRSIFPNPSSGQINFDRPLEEGTLEITNLQGSTVASFRITSGTTSIQPVLQSGYYVLNYQNGTSFSRMPVVITD